MTITEAARDACRGVDHITQARCVDKTMSLTKRRRGFARREIHKDFSYRVTTFASVMETRHARLPASWLLVLASDAASPSA